MRIVAGKDLTELQLHMQHHKKEIENLPEAKMPSEEKKNIDSKNSIIITDRFFVATMFCGYIYNDAHTYAHRVKHGSREDETLLFTDHNHLYVCVVCRTVCMLCRVVLCFVFAGIRSAETQMRGKLKEVTLRSGRGREESQEA